MRPRKKKTWSVDRIKHPKYPKITVRIGEFQAGGMLHVFSTAQSHDPELLPPFCRSRPNRTWAARLDRPCEPSALGSRRRQCGVSVRGQLGIASAQRRSAFV